MVLGFHGCGIKFTFFVLLIDFIKVKVLLDFIFYKKSFIKYVIARLFCRSNLKIMVDVGLLRASQ